MTSKLPLLLALGILGIACGGSESHDTDDSLVVGGGPIPMMHGNSAWLECSDGTLSMNVFDHRVDAVNETDLNLFIGQASASGRLNGTNVHLAGNTFSFDGSADVDFPNNTLKLKGSFTRGGSASDIDRTLSCNALGLDYGTHGPAATGAVQGHGDSTWLVCDSATITANVVEHRSGAADRATDVTLVVGGGSIVAGTLGAATGDATVSGTLDAKAAAASSDAFHGTATVGLTHTQSIKLKGSYLLNGTSYTVDQTIACKQLFADL